MPTTIYPWERRNRSYSYFTSLQTESTSATPTSTTPEILAETLSRASLISRIEVMGNTTLILFAMPPQQAPLLLLKLPTSPPKIPREAATYQNSPNFP